MHVHKCNLIGHTYLFLGWNWALRTGDGNRNLRSISPEAMSHNNTFQSVEELSSFRPLLFQLRGREEGEKKGGGEEGGVKGGEGKAGGVRSKRKKEGKKERR